MPPTRLSAQDAAFVFGEDQRIPLHVGCLGVLDAAPLRDPDGVVDLARLRAGIEERLYRFPVFRRRLQQIPLDAGRPVWVDDPKFRIEHHVHLTALPRPGTRRQLLDLMGRVQGRVLDRNRPLWELLFVEGLAGGEKLAVIARVHHAMIDGTSGVALATLMFDLSPHPSRPQPPPWQPAPLPASGRLLLRAGADHARDLLEGARGIGRALSAPTRPLAALGKLYRALGTVSPQLDRLPFNQRVGSRRAFETVSLPLEELLQARRAFGVKVNDIALAAVAGAVRRYCAGQGLDPEQLTSVRTLCPVDVRPEGDTQLGSNVSAMMVELPVDEADPGRRVERVAAHSRSLKHMDVAAGASLWVSATSVIPTTLLRAASWFQFRGLMANANLMLSNVRGPDQPLYSFGARVEAFFPYFGVQDGLGLNVVLFSYDGQLLVGLAADPDLVPDLGEFAELLRKAFGELASRV